MKLRFIGDVHGDMEQYLKATVGAERSVQVGDFGLGWLKPVDLYQLDLTKNGLREPRNHWVIRGNHDDPASGKAWDMCRDSWGHEDGLFWMGGATSIDRQWRCEGVSWWPDEQLCIKDLRLAREDFIEHEPRVVVTHDCPQEIARLMTHEMGRGFMLEDSRTRMYLQEMLDEHEPEVWVFGHWHMSWRKRIGRTLFVCLDIGETFDLELE